MTTETDICNLALDLIKEAPITSLEEDRPTSRWMKRNFAIQRDIVLAMANWNFATERAALAKDSVAPAFGWDYAYTLPPAVSASYPLRMTAPTKEGRCLML